MFTNYAWESVLTLDADVYFDTETEEMTFHFDPPPTDLIDAIREVYGDWRSANIQMTAFFNGDNQAVYPDCMIINILRC